jgi:hypothetical protein
MPELGQVITFVAPTSVSLGTTPTLTATTTGTSMMPITFTSTTPNFCTVTSAGVLTPVAVGACTILANQLGDATHNPAAQVSQNITVKLASSTVTVASSANPSVYGQAVSFTATLTNPVPTTGTIQWAVNGTNSGAPVAVSATGTSTFTPVQTTPLAIGSYIVSAAYVPATADTTHGPATGQVTQVVGKAKTTTTVTVNTGGALSATVAPVSPGVGLPTGTVTFTVGGVAAGSAAVGAGGVAVVTASNVGNQAVSATYSGDADFLGSSGNRTAVGPTVTTHVSSAHAKTKYGWYRSPVTVSFSCVQGTAVATCPAPITLSSGGAGQSVTKTVTAADGGTTTVSVSPINIDRTKPTLTVKRSGHTLSCHGADALSGLASCKITRHHTTKHGKRTVHWTGTATDKAGNTKVKHGSFSYKV